MFGCDRFAAAWASRRNRSTKARVGRELGEQDLQGDRAPEEEVAGQEHLRGPAVGDLVTEFVAPTDPSVCGVIVMCAEA